MCSTSLRLAVSSIRFNEAAGIPRGRRSENGRARHRRRSCASMRPRVFPAEDASISALPSQELGPGRFNEAAGIPRGRLDRRGDSRQRGPAQAASMRPRVFPAEDVVPARRSSTLSRRASMRPRVFPAEDLASGRCRACADDASMRPRVFPAEDRHPCRTDRRRVLQQTASMRPRVFPAEDAFDGCAGPQRAALQ